MSIQEPDLDAIKKAFKNTNFGGPEKTEKGRLDLVAECIIQRACEFSCGGTIEQICIEAGLMTSRRRPTKAAKQWAFVYIRSRMRVTTTRVECVKFLRMQACRDVPEPFDPNDVPAILRYAANYLDAGNVDPGRPYKVIEGFNG